MYVHKWLPYHMTYGHWMANNLFIYYPMLLIAVFLYVFNNKFVCFGVAILIWGIINFGDHFFYTMKDRKVSEKVRLVERENISRNIHNSVGHSITAAIMALDAADELYNVRPEEARKRMNDAKERIHGSLESIRRAVRILDEDSAEIVAGDLKCEMKNTINEFVMDTDICVNQDFDQLLEDIRIPYDHAVFLTGALQEMLTNGIKHGNASEFVVVLLGDIAHIRLEVLDNGNSDFDSSNSKSRIENGFGIKKIISYVEKCGGKTAFFNDNGFKGMVDLAIVLEG